MRLESEQFATFVPADPPRAGALAVWGDGQGSDELDLVLPAGGGIAAAAGPRAAAAARVGPAGAAGTGRRRGRRARWRPGRPRRRPVSGWWRGGACCLPPAPTGTVRGGSGRWMRPTWTGCGGSPPRCRRRATPCPSTGGARCGCARRRGWSVSCGMRSPTPWCGPLRRSTRPGRVPLPRSSRSRSGSLSAGWRRPTGGWTPGRRCSSGSSCRPKEEEPFAGVVQVRSAADPSLVVDAGELWSAPAAVLARLGERAETDLLLALRRGARAWPPLAPLLRSAAPTEVSLDEEQLAELLETGAEALGGAGIEVLWPAELLGEGLDVRATVATPTPAGAAAPVFRLEALLSFDWQVTVGGEALTAEEVAALAEAKRPLVRLRGRWVRVNRELLERLRRRRGPRITAAEALAAALTGSLVVDGERVEFHAAGALADLVDRLAGAGRAAVEPPEGLRATLRPYQRRGLSWLAQMCELGLGGCLADDMGLGKTVQVIALHLHRRSLAAGPTLVVCPTSLLGNWERELARFAPDVPVRRYHGGGRHLERAGGRRGGAGHLRGGAPRPGGAGRGRLGPGGRRRGAARQEPAVAHRAGAARDPGGGQGGADRHAGGEPADRAVVDPGLDDPRAARSAGAVPPVGRGAGRALPRRGRHRAAGPGGAAVPAAAPQERPADRSGAAGQDRDRSGGAAHGRAGDAVRGGGARDAGQDRLQRGHRAARSGARAAHRPQAGLQPPGAVSARDRAAGRPFREAGRPRRAARGHPRRGGGGAGVQPVRRDVRG